MITPRIRSTLLIAALIAAGGSLTAQEAKQPGWKPLVHESQQGSYNAFHYAPAVEIGDLIILSGVVGVGSGDNSAEAQLARAFERLSARLEELGLTLRDVAEITTYHVKMGENQGSIMPTKDRFLTEPYPAWTAVGVERLWMPQALIEIRAVAVRPKAE